MPRAEKQGWWERNWGWALGCGCLAILAVPAACAGLIWFGAQSFLGSGPVQTGLERARAHPEVVEALGEPVELKMSGIQGSFNYEGGDEGNMNARLPLSGSHGSGTLHIVAVRDGDEWIMETLEVVIEERDGVIDLLAGTPAPALGEPDPLHPEEEGSEDEPGTK